MSVEAKVLVLSPTPSQREVETDTVPRVGLGTQTVRPLSIVLFMETRAQGREGAGQGHTVS